MNLYFLKYNNYYNRIIKREDNLNAYTPYQVGTVLQGVSFNPNDDVMTQQVVNRKLKDIGDYLLVVDDSNTINSRWFIIESKRERQGQYTLTLRRDLVADNYNEVINSPCFIEKATLQDNDPMIFNSEDMTFNQIKTSETLLKDETGSAWVVGYIPSDSLTQDTTIQSKVTLDATADYVVENLSDFEYFANTTSPYIGNPTQLDFNIFFYHVQNAIARYDRFTFGPGGTYGTGWNFKQGLNGQYNSENELGLCSDINDIFTSQHNGSIHITPELSLINNGTSSIPKAWIKMMLEGNRSNVNGQSNQFNTYDPGLIWAVPTMIEQAKSVIPFHSVAEETEFKNLQNKVIKETSTGLFYKINVNRIEVSDIPTKKGQEGNFGTAIPVGSSLYNTIYNNMPKNYSYGSTNYVMEGTPNARAFSMNISYYAYTISFDQVFIDAKTTINGTRYHLEDSPYDMFCIPYSNDLKIYKNGQEILTASKSIALNMGIEIAHDAGSQTVYDVQLLPYCPVRYCIKPDGTFDIGDSRVHYITNNDNENIGVILWATTSSFTFNINKEINVENLKQQSQTDLWRLSSPNYNGQFEFNVAKNRGINYFNVDCSYKPFNPYIHINPNFKALYGQDFNDARGLICGGDFSLPQITSAWSDYQLQNKNYQQIFDRQIQNMEVNNAIQREKEVWGVASGAIGATAGGAAAGAMLGGPVGAVVGGILGAGASTAAGIRDLQLNDKARAEALDYTKDQFGYQLGNIQALPTSLSKTSAFTFNNKIFPVLEYYTCTDIEKQALRDKLKYNGMTVMRIGTINEFMQDEPSYIKGKLIRIENFNEDFHVLNELANEINKGVFI